MIEIVEGYAIPWAPAAAHVDGLVETVAPYAIAADTARNITMLFGDHVADGRRVYASTGRQTLRFHHDEFGLAFRAEVDASTDAARSMLRAIANGSTIGCSVNFIHMDRHSDGKILSGLIDHFTVCSHPAYQDTACWIAAQPMRDRPSHVRELSAFYQKARLEMLRKSRSDSLRGRQSPGSTPPRRAAPASQSRVTLPPSVLNFMTSSDFRLLGQMLARADAFLSNRETTQVNPAGAAAKNRGRCGPVPAGNHRIIGSPMPWRMSPAAAAAMRIARANTHEG